MHDMLDVPVIEIGDEKRRVVGPDVLDVRLDNNGELIGLLVLDPDGWVVREIPASSVVDWHAVKIEDNIGYGLWQPYDVREYNDVLCLVLILTKRWTRLGWSARQRRENNVLFKCSTGEEVKRKSCRVFFF
jgi:hypothetical protein